MAVDADARQWNTREFFETATVLDVTVCLAVGADAAARNDANFTPLHWAAIGSSDPAIFGALVRAGADLEAVPDFGNYTPLHLAARDNENPAVSEALLAAGADPTALDDDVLPKIDIGGGPSYGGRSGGQTLFVGQWRSPRHVLRKRAFLCELL